MTVADVRAFIARIVLGDATDVPRVIGTVTLRPPQLAAAARLCAAIDAHGGALLADPVGTGKTYTALAVASVSATSPAELLIAAPASLREMWRDALSRTQLRASIITHEALSRGDAADVRASFIIVDEAHRLRNPSTRRYAAAAELCRHARVLLLTATPIQNSRNDLAALLALFVGRRAWSLDDAAMAAFVIRDGVVDTASMPAQVGPITVALDISDDCVDDLVGLPPPVPARDESIAAALLTFSLVHQWTSSRAALAASLRRRRTRALAMLEILESGRVPSRAELAAWTHLGDAMQLAFPELVVAPETEATDGAALHAAISAHLRAVERLLDHLRRPPNPDEARARALREIRRRHPGERIIAFCHYAETVAALYDALRGEPGVAAMTASGGRVAGGRIARADVLRQFAPDAADRVRPSERIDLLLTTDVLSEGLNLQAASVVVHLDLPWNPARLEQRVGRVRRFGSPHTIVTVYSLAPPAHAERLLQLDERLRDKLRVARRTVGIAGQILPSPFQPARDPSHAELASDIRRRLASWMNESPFPASARPLVGACRAACAGFVALLDDKTLVAKLEAELTTSARAIAEALCRAGADDADVDESFLNHSLRLLDSWLQHRRGVAAVDFAGAAAARARRAALARVSRALARAPRHRRAQLAPLAEAARNVAAATLPEGAERVFDMLVRSELPDEAWLRSLAAFGELNVRRAPERDAAVRPEVLAIILFQPARL